MSLPRVLELMMTFLEDAISRKKKKNPTTLIGSLKNIFLKFYVKVKIFSQPIIQFVKEGERGQNFSERIKEIKPPS